MSNSYKKAMDKIQLSDELREKIIKNASASPKKKLSAKKRRLFLQPAYIAACLAVCLVSVGAIMSYRKPTTIIPMNDNIEINGESANNTLPPHTSGKKVVTDSNISNTENTPSPELVRVVIADMEEMASKLGRRIEYPQKLPADFTLTSMYVINGSKAEMIFEDEADMITYSTVNSIEEAIISDGHELMEIVNISGSDVILSGTGELYFNATWYKNGCTYCIVSRNGLEKMVITELVSNVG